MNFTKMVKGLYSENCNTLMKKTEEVLNKLKAIPSSCTERKYDTNLYNTQINLQLQCSPCKNLNGIFKISNNFKICMEPQTPQIYKPVLRYKNEPGGIILPDFKVYYKVL